MKILVTGAAGFAGAHIVEEILETTDWEVVALDCLTYAGRLDRLAHLDRKRIQFVYHDIREPFSSARLKQIGNVSYVIHNAAESHVMRSFANPKLFVESNAIGTLNVLEAARRMTLSSFIYVSTDEVLGSAQEVPFVESDPMNPTNPYAATKACGELLAYSYFRSFGLPVVITRTMNMFGERQHPEKFVPMTIKKILNGEIVKIHGYFNRGLWISGSRHWLHARAQANALLFLLKHGTRGEKYHISGEEYSNWELAHRIAHILNMVINSEGAAPLGPVHDIAYSLNGNKLKNLGWKSPASFDESLKQTVLFTKEHPEYLEE